MQKRSGVTNLPLHGGHAPPWLFKRMIKLAGSIFEVISYEYGINEILGRLSNPYWFQAFSCILGFDWHSSGTTTTTCGAIKIAIKPHEHGMMVCGGKGKSSRRTPQEIRSAGDIFSFSSKKIEELVYSSKISAKVDNSCLQDGYQLYHHCFIVTEEGKWTVIQQGMNKKTRYARRYHWLSDTVTDMVEEPHQAICSNHKHINTLDLTAKESMETRKISLDLILDNPEHLRKYIRTKNERLVEEQSSLYDHIPQLTMPAHHPVLDMDLSPKEFQVLKNAWEIQPDSYEELISLKGMGSKKIRALALISDLIYGSEPSWEDPVKYSFTHGGKDGFPYPVDRDVYDNSVQTLKDSLEQAKLDNMDKLKAIKRLDAFINTN